MIDPLGFVAKGILWYLVAASEGEIHPYRVSRVLGATVADQLAVRSRDFDLAVYWRQASADFQAALPRNPTTLRVVESVLPKMRRIWRFARIQQIESADPEGWVRVRVQFEVEDEACEYVLSCGRQDEVVEPPELRQRVAQLATSVAQLYARETRQARHS